MMKSRVLIVCNALDDTTRIARGITTDSPAASRKIFQLCQALRLAGITPWVISLGRGKAGGSKAFFPRVIRRVDGIPVCYMPFSKIPILSELISMLAPVVIIFQLRRQTLKSVIFYNRQAAYLFSLLASSILNYRCVLDLEDGEISVSGYKYPHFFMRLMFKLYDCLCSQGALLACSALAKSTTARPVLPYYGTAIGKHSTKRWKGEYITVLMGGTLAPDTGAELLIDTIRKLRQDAPALAKQLCFEVTGKGSSLAALQTLAIESKYPKIIIHGRTTDQQYREVLNRCDVGLALKPNIGPLANTTFPSKVIEFASSGLLVLTTDISDVRNVLNSGALYLTQDEPQMFIELLRHVVKDRTAAQECAERGMHKVQKLCSPRLAGQTVANFIFGND